MKRQLEQIQQQSGQQQSDLGREQMELRSQLQVYYGGKGFIFGITKWDM